jgi:hypothetical protein
MLPAAVERDAQVKAEGKIMRYFIAIIYFY